MMNKLARVFAAFAVAGSVMKATDAFAKCDTVHASYYGEGFDNNKTANGERFNRWAMTAAHKTLPFGTRLEVSNPRNGKSVIVRINDRGPFIRGRSLDLSEGAAIEIGLKQRGVGSVEMCRL